MDHFGGPAVLGGIITGLMLWAWALGRWQGNLPGAPVRALGEEPRMFDFTAAFGNPSGAKREFQQVACDERLAALGDGTSLGQIHAEVSAYRQAAQVLTHLEAEDMPLGWLPASADDSVRRYPGISENPACPVADPAVVHLGCDTCGEPMPDLVIRVDQPSAEGSAFTCV